MMNISPEFTFPIALFSRDLISTDHPKNPTQYSQHSTPPCHNNLTISQLHKQYNIDCTLCDQDILICVVNIRVVKYSGSEESNQLGYQSSLTDPPEVGPTRRPAEAVGAVGNGGKTQGRYVRPERQRSVNQTEVGY